MADTVTKMDYDTHGQFIGENDVLVNKDYRPTQYIIVLDKASNSLVSLARERDFDGSRHERVDVQAFLLKKYGKQEPVVAVDPGTEDKTVVSVTKADATETQEDADKYLFEEMKKKGFIHLSKSEKGIYSKLKAKYGAEA